MTILNARNKQTKTSKQMKINIKRLLFAFALACLSIQAQAQIGYQVSLLNTATGEPRANVTVNAQVTITDSQDNTIYTGSQQATTNDFGVLSLAVGDASTFANADTGKMPFFISVSVDGTLIGRSQILNVPVAEVANKLKSSFTKEDLVGTWTWTNDYQTQYFVFKNDGTFTFHRYYNGKLDRQYLGEYKVIGDEIRCFSMNKTVEIFYWHKSMLYSEGAFYYTKQ